MLSVNLLPLFVINKRIIKRIAGTITIINLGGIVEVSWNTFLKERMPVTASQTTNTIAAVGLFFTALINNKKVRITVSKKIAIRLSGRWVSIYMIYDVTPGFKEAVSKGHFRPQRLKDTKF
jgi:hypothetical protein